MAGRAAVLRIDILADAGKAVAELDRADSKLGKFAKVGAVAAAAGVAAIGAAAGAFAVQAVGAASKLEQAFGGTEAIFAGQADAIKALANDAATGVGLAASEYSELANVLGSQLKNLGTESDQLVPKTDALIKQGADLAATFGGSTADAVSAVSSLLKGERDPIERYGVSIKAADVQARLAAEGLDGLTGAARTQAETQATLALLTEQTAAAQGAFAREGETLAGQQQRLGAIWENLKATVGTALLPVLTALGSYVLDRLVPAAQSLAARFSGELGPGTERLAGIFTGTVIPAARGVWEWFTQKIAPGLNSALRPALAGIQSAFGTVTAKIRENEATFRKIGTVIKTVAEFIASDVAPVVGTVLGFAFQTLGTYIGGVIDTITLFVNGIESAVENIRDLVNYIRNSGAGQVIGGIASGVGSLLSSRSAEPGTLTAAHSAARNLIAAGGTSSGAGGLISVDAPAVTVVIEGRVLTELVDYRVRRQASSTARRLSHGGVRP